MTSLQASVSVDIAASSEAVYEVLTDPSRMPEWVSGVQSAEWSSGSGPEPGSTIQMSYKYGRKVNDITMEVTEADPGVRYEYRTIKGPYPINARFTIMGSATQTAVTYEQTAFSDSMLASIGFFLTSWFAKPMVRKTLRKDMAKLAALVEGSETDR